MTSLLHTEVKTKWQRRKKWVKNTWMLFKKSKVGVLGLVILAIFFVLALASVIPPKINEMYIPLYGTDPEIMGISPPSLRHPLGTDFMGRDLFSQLLEGAKWALIVGITAATAAVVVGTVVGLVSGYSGGIADTLLQRTADILLTLPGIPIILVIGAALGQVSIWTVVILIALLGWPGPSKVIRAQVLSLRERPFIESATVSGASSKRIIFRHIAPNVLPLSFLYMTFGVTTAILLEAGLSFIGMGDPSTVSWGMMLQWCFTSGNTFNAPYWLLPPGLCITVLALSFYLIGIGTQQIVNPRLRER
ncbi:MAG: ABC transporter permease [Theionarchaea archaeon]|nr:MAG: peptide ABC transporter permease [Theionarchaea archaeon DG-70-1]MBU7030250.1 ABC transporter permease [Theionarchaea archaeon]